MHAKVKAISPLVAALLLIIVGIAGAVLVYLWLTGFAGKSAVIPSTMKIEIKVEAADLAVDTTNKQTTVTTYVRNVGSVTIPQNTEVGIYVYDSDTGAFVGTCTTTLDNDVPPGDLIELQCTIKNTVLDTGKYYDVQVSILGVDYYVLSVRPRQVA